MVQDMLMKASSSRTSNKKLATTTRLWLWCMALLLFSHASVMATAWTTTTTTLSNYHHGFRRQKSTLTTISFGTPVTTLRGEGSCTTELFASKSSRGTSVPQQRRFSLINSLRGGTENKVVGTKDRKTATTVAASASSSASNNGSGSISSSVFRWTLAKAVRALVVFVLAGVAEIGGGWLVWKAVREHKPWWWAVVGSLVLVLYGFIPTLQPTDSFGRIYAVYGGFFIALSYAWGWIFDGMKLDAGDIVGGSLALVGVLVILFWPRK